jgi:thioredoxin 1
MATVKIDTSNFQSDVLQAGQPVVVDFWAEWCGPCKMIAPSSRRIASEMEGKVTRSPSSISMRIRSLPLSSAYVPFQHCSCSRMAKLPNLVGAAPKSKLSELDPQFGRFSGEKPIPYEARLSCRAFFIAAGFRCLPERHRQDRAIRRSEYAVQCSDCPSCHA